ncbi:hypothetical protein [Streptomyces sp. NPDC018000]|uniref:hypothetical protein n=1 Tax=Streptomyces sp. NPDC018000 TaxID=3365028 RepID=UPI003796331E
MYPQQPHVALAPEPSPISPPKSRSRTAVVVVSLLLGLALGGGAVAIAWVLSDNSSSSVEGVGPRGDASAACRALDGFDESKYIAKGSAGEIAVNRYAAAGVLSASAAAGDATYRPLAQAIRRSQDRHAQAFDFDEKVKKDLDEARSICKGL